MKLRFKRKQIIIVIILAFLALVVGWTVWGNLTIGTTHYEIAFENLPSSFEGYKIAQISDLHNAKFGENNARIIEILHEENPDMIAITGDLIDSNRTDIDIAVQFMQQAVHIAPCYYVTGNHEAWIGEDYQQLEKKMIDVGVRILHDEVMPIYKDGESIQLIGLDDPDFTDRDAVVQDSMLDSKLKNLKLQDGFKLLLSHRPETVHSYVSTNVDLVLSGHAHGGQFRMPFIGGIVAPNQGLFPEYDAGVFDERGTTMVVSRGIGNSIIPVRLNNRPEIVIVKLQPKS
ncbi:MAG TPA: metallophosphoesterase [Candidatus Dorea intestinavium]|nr:metallophosphoesterase [Candidatus Dorea intestinavium]